MRVDVRKLDKKLLRSVCIEEKYLDVNITSHPIAPFREALKEARFVTSRELRKKRPGQKVKVAGRTVLVHTPPTKSGIRVMFITAEDEFGLLDLVLFPNKQKLYAKTVLSCAICLYEGYVRRVGIRDVSVVVERVFGVCSL